LLLGGGGNRSHGKAIETPSRCGGGEREAQGSGQEGADEIECSMSRKGNCWDNAVVESFFSSLKQELVYLSTFNTHQEAQLALFEYIEVFYNRKRRHSSLGYLSPVEYERSVLPSKLAA
jgi:transposase InsO family protein